MSGDGSTAYVDLVVDANVFAHACNPNSPYFDSALELVNDLRESRTRLALDDTGKTSPNEWTSNLYREYTECVPPGSVSSSVLVALLAGNRVDFYLRPKKNIWEACKRLVPRNNHDAIVLGIGCSGKENLVVSNDYDDFSGTVRSDCQKKIGVTIVDSEEHAAAVA